MYQIQNFQELAFPQKSSNKSLPLIKILPRGIILGVHTIIKQYSRHFLVIKILLIQGIDPLKSLGKTILWKNLSDFNQMILFQLLFMIKP